MADKLKIKSALCGESDCYFDDSYHGHYVIPGLPVPLARARFGAKRVWDAQKEVRVMTGILLANAHGNRPLFKGPLVVHMFFYFPVPQSYSKKKKQSLIHELHAFKPDLSNLVKFVEDAATGILYKDDCQISRIAAYKRYAEEPQTLLVISEQK